MPASLFALLRQHPDAFQGDELIAIFRFVSFAARLKDDVLLAQPSNQPADNIPLVLPFSIVLLLSRVCNLSESLVIMCWDCLKDVIWRQDMLWTQDESMEALIQYHGHNLGFSSLRTLYPPQHECINVDCERRRNDRRLTKTEPHQAVLYTLCHGVLPVWMVPLYCNTCRITYHHNFYVKDGQRTYYDHIPDIIQAGEHQFVERRVALLWRTDMLIAWKSATNCARSYHLALSAGYTPPSDWKFGFTLKPEHVYDTFIILSLLEDHARRKSTLVVPHIGNQKDRFRDAMQARNVLMRLYSQPEIRHYCSKCVRMYKDPDGRVNRMVSAVVVDGVTVGRPCCAVHNCKVPLASNRARYCPIHNDLHRICAIIGCNAPALDGKKACGMRSHQDIECVHMERGRALFQLKERLKRAQVAHPNDAVAEEIDLSSIADDEPEQGFAVHDEGRVVPDDNASTDRDPRVKRVRAQFGRRRTHNEQIIVAPCGIILSRATFYGAEAVSSVAEMIKRTFRIKGHMPNHILFDNNCKMKKVVIDDPAFANVGLSVDVFHFKCKHSEKDTFCQENCNPALFPELLSEDGGWYFNSSIAEQTNVWLGGFHAICREMLPDKYDFFLDEMILQRNCMTKEKLEREGKGPSTWPAYASEQ